MTHPGTSEGFALLTAVIGALVAAGLAYVMLISAAGSHRLADLQVLEMKTHYLAEGAVEIAKRDIRAVVAAGATAPAAGVAMVDGVAVPYTVRIEGAPTVSVDASGFNTTRTSYEIAATARVGPMTHVGHRIINVSTLPLFQYAVFFKQSLDILPTPDMTLRGRVHTNGDLRLGSNSGTLTLDTNHVRCAGKVRRWKEHSDTPTVGNVKIRRWVVDPFDGSEPAVFEDMESRGQMTALGISTVTGYDELFGGHDGNSDGDYDDPGDWLPFGPAALERYGPPAGYTPSGFTLLSEAHGVAEAVPPPIESIDKFVADPAGNYRLDTGSMEYVYDPPNGTHRKGFFHAIADVTIMVAADATTWQAYDSSGFVLTGTVAPAVTMATTYDERQGGYVPVVKIDVSALNAPTIFPANGLLYVSHYGMGTGTNSRGVHLVNGASLADKLTVVTEGSAYLQGDYNTSSPKSAAVICDAVNMLSNSWFNGPTEPTATDTTYVAALVIGNIETDPGIYSGGLENFPRFHEDWAGVTCTVIGSMNSIWDQRYADGLMVDARYSPPIRAYGYDTRFNDPAQLPPFTPNIVTVQDVIRF